MAAGANADVGLFSLKDGEFEFRDTDGNSIQATKRIVADLTIKDGSIWYERQIGRA